MPYEITEDTYLGAMESVEEDGPIMLLFLAHAPPSKLVNQIHPIRYFIVLLWTVKGFIGKWVQLRPIQRV